MKVSALSTWLLCQAVAVCGVAGFAPARSFVKPQLAATGAGLVSTQNSCRSKLNLMDSSIFVESTTSVLNSFDTSSLLAFTDQGQNLAGTFFQASLLPYLAFLYFLAFRGNRIPALGNFGFQYILFFVLSTIPSGIISKATYGVSLANVDWLHGAAELLLTLANILVVFGFKEAMTNPDPTDMGRPRNIAIGVGAGFAALCFGGLSLGLDVHAPFLFGLGNLPTDVAFALPWVSHSEPINALSIPTWLIHFSSVIEYLIAMSLVWDFSKTTSNETWKGLTWGMLPLHASGICACTYHFFYNASVLQFLVSMQAGFTLLGNTTCAIAAYRIAKSNGWSLAEVNPFPKSPTSPAGLIVDATAAMPLEVEEPKESNAFLAAKIAASTVLLSYLVKYGELGLDLPFTPNAPAALAIVLGVPAATAAIYINKSQETGGLSLPSFGGDGEGGLSMADVRKYGVSGTVAYVLTELAFWAVAFPVASTALYQSTGHWPDVINDTTDRATVLGFIFAGANIARLLVPVRLGAALALAPWVDENILNRQGGSRTTTDDEASSEVKTLN